MRQFLGATLLCLMAAAPAFAADAAPTEQSIRHLLEVSDSKKLLDNALASIDASMDAGIKASLAGKTIDEKTQKVIDNMRRKLGDLMKESLAWQDMEPLFIDVYQRSLTQQEVDGIVKFYESAAGQALIRKMPLIMQNTMQLMQGRMQALAPKIAQLQQEAMQELKAEEAK